MAASETPSRKGRGLPASQVVLFLFPVLFIGVFTVVSYRQVSDLNERITEANEMQLDGLWAAQPGDSLVQGADYVNLQKWRSLAAMEHLAITKRYQQGGLLIIARIFTKYLGFLTGMIMAIAGAVFIIGRIREDESRISLSAAGKQASLRSTSPGVFFGVLGTVLMAMTILQHTDIGITDRPLYLHPYNNLLTGPPRGAAEDAAFLQALRDVQLEMGGDSSAGGPSNQVDTARQRDRAKSTVDPKDVTAP